MFSGKTFSHGVHAPDNKHRTSDLAVRRIPFSEHMVIPLSQHFGAPSVPIVHAGQEVVRGEPIAKADGFMSVPMHSPGTGVIEDIGLMPTARGPKTPSIILRLHPGAGQNVLYGARRDITTMTPEEIIQAVQDSGMVGMGGAAFPTHVKMAAAREKPVDTLLVNGCECEPYLTTDHRVMLEHADELIQGIHIVLKALGCERTIIGIEDNKLNAARFLRAKLPKDGDIEVRTLETKYPQGAEKILIKTILNREVPSGGFPADAGVAVFNVTSMMQIGRLLPRSRGVIARVVTITGPGVKRPGNYLIPMGTPLRFVLKHVGYTGGAHNTILGGPMMGMSVASLDVPVTKATSGILVFSEKETALQTQSKVYPCIRCGRCVEVCPIHLNPSQLGLLASKRQYDVMQDQFHLNDCFECGCCSYVCPSAIPLVQYFRIAKAVNRENRARAA
ncbi:MAG: electron transport complex subunit RsxC [Gammaproteobacteria bacterium]|nr:MAG: electron transport complex subunit RsxC [Gammaproteobacteria bacterium]